MKTLFGGIIGSCFVFVVGLVTFPKTERTYTRVDWKPTDYITIPVNVAKNDLYKFEHEIELEKRKIEKEIEKAKKIGDTLE